MPGGKKLVVVMSVLVTGVSTALFFRKDASQEDFRHEASPENPFRQRVERRVVADTTWTRNLQTARPKLASRSVDALRVPATASIPQGLNADSQPTIQRSSNPVGALLVWRVIRIAVLKASCPPVPVRRGKQYGHRANGL